MPDRTQAAVQLTMPQAGQADVGNWSISHPEDGASCRALGRRSSMTLSSRDTPSAVLIAATSDTEARVDGPRRADATASTAAHSTMRLARVAMSRRPMMAPEYSEGYSP